MIKVRDIMVSPVITIDADATVEEACRIMGEKHIGSVIITEAGKPSGIFTERDLLTKILLKDHSLMKEKVKKFMSSPLTVITPDFELKEAARVMTQLKIRRLPVVHMGQLLGIITSADITRAIGESPLNI
ncbi:MAG: cyclic nucleotide-binding/CBS domain-containing protein [Nitrososphaerales archaeon]